MRFSAELKEKICDYLVNSISLKSDFSESKKASFTDVLIYKIHEGIFYSIMRQHRDNKGEIKNIRFNRIIYSLLKELPAPTKYCDEKRHELIGIMESSGVQEFTSELIIEDTVCQSETDYKLLVLIDNYLKLRDFKRTKLGNYDDIAVAEDSFLFEQLILKVTKETLGMRQVFCNLVGIRDIGQSLQADVIARYKNNNSYRILDAKFYNSDILYISHGKPTYKNQNNRFQMSAYMTELSIKENVDISSIRGYIVHAVDSDKYAKWRCLEDGKLDIGNQSITLKFIHIDTDLETLIKQIREIIT